MVACLARVRSADRCPVGQGDDAAGLEPRSARGDTGVDATHPVAVGVPHGVVGCRVGGQDDAVETGGEAAVDDELGDVLADGVLLEAGEEGV